MDPDLKRLADAAERLEAQARELRADIEGLAETMRARAEAETVSASPAEPEAGADASEARIVAYSMVLDGRPREQVARHLADELGFTDSDALLDDLYARVG